MTRTDNIKRNLIFNMLKYVANLILQFIIRTVLIYSLGAEYIGLNGLFTNIFSFLNLAELGIGSAIVFSMYKPIAEGDTEKVKALQNLYKKFYFIIAIIIFVVGLILTPFLKSFIKDEITADINIYILFILYLVNTLAGYFCAHKRSLLFAYQRNDVENKIRTLCVILMSIIQAIVLILFKNYYLYFSITIIFTIIECLWVYKIANKMYPEINGKSKPLDETTKKEITKNITALSMHKIGGAVVFSTDSILTSIFCGLVVLGAYSNYTLIISAIISIFIMLTNALQGSVGNLVASQSVEYVHDRFKLVNFIYSYLAAFTTICLVVLFQPFISLWTGGDIYLLDFSTVILICLSFYFTRMRSGVGIFKDAAGLFWYNKWMPIVESFVNLMVSVVMASLIGINGIFIGTIISTLVAPFWIEPHILHKHYFKKSSKKYFIRYILDFTIMVIICVITYLICSLIPVGGIWWLILRFAVCILASNILLIIVYFPTKEFKQVFSIGKSLLKNFIKKDKV